MLSLSFFNRPVACRLLDAADMASNAAKKTLNRRQVLAAIGAGFGAAIAGCSNSSTAPTATSNTSASGGTSSAACAVIPAETEGPYPDMTGMISNPAFFRRDITEGKAGLPLTLTLTLVNASSGCSPLGGYNIEVWQCDAGGNYSEYSQPGFNGTGQTFLRGVQTTDVNGQVTFNTIYPGWYQGRATHIHVDVFRGTSLVRTTQIAFPEDVTRAVYATGAYAAKGQSPTSNASDMVFADGVQSELATLTGNATSGYTATLRIGISA
jgi:protocatechuate 3,4-dioxygenase beta subunit